jgi:glutamyl-tRNA synthetase
MRNEQQKNKQLPKYDGHCRHLTPEEVAAKKAAGDKWVVRLKAPSMGIIGWEDLIRGHVEFAATEVDDAVLIKSDGFPTYHFAVVIDDHLMKITHVLRGEEWISSTPKHLLLYQAFGWQPPLLAHMPLIRNQDKSKLSKRKNDVSILSYRDKGYLPEALLNFIALLGWSHPDKKEIFSFAEFLQVMSLDRIQKTGPVFDVNKLNWMNGLYIRELARPDLIVRLQPFLPADFPDEKIDQLLDLVTERLVTLADIESLTAFFYREITVKKEELTRKSTPAEVLDQLQATQAVLEKMTNWTVSELETQVRELQESRDFKKSQYFMMLRVTVTGQTATPPLFETIAVLGKEVTLHRISAALTLLS